VAEKLDLDPKVSAQAEQDREDRLVAMSPREDVPEDLGQVDHQARLA
jgi:hypothetical protein